MNIALLVQTTFILALLIGLDYLVFYFRRGGTLQNLMSALLSWSKRALNFFAALPRLAPSKPEPANLPARPEPASLEPAAPASEPLSPPAPATNNGLVRVNISAELPPDTIVHITIATDSLGRVSVEQEQPLTLVTRQPAQTTLPILARFKSFLSGLQFTSRPRLNLATVLFFLALAVYLITRLVGLEDFPIYFFGDEAVQTVSAANLLARGLRGPDGTFLPTYFQNGSYYNLSASVYLQALSLLFFDKSIFMARATSVVVTLLAVISVGLILRNTFQARHWWLATLLLSLAPAWFLHSRTAFETALFVSFYAGFLYFYLEYRLRDPRNVYPALLMAGLAFYAYSPGQLVLAATGFFLLLNDLQYHWKQRPLLLKALILAAVIAIPYLRFRLTFEYSPLDHLRQLGSYWIQPLPLTQKLGLFAQQYLFGLSPQYWFSSNNSDLARHQMLGYGNLSAWMLPLILLGVGVALYRLRSTAYRIVLLAALASPAGAALAQIGITRVLAFVVPATLLAAIGLNFLLELIETWRSQRNWKILSGPLFSHLLGLVLFTGLAAANFAMLSDALKNGPTWFTDYGLYGMQYGAKQVYQETVVPGLKSDPAAYYVVTPSWANGAEQFIWFFVPPELAGRVMLGQVYNLLERRPLPDANQTFYIVSPEEFQKISTDSKFKVITVRSIIPYPDGNPGFYVLNIEFANNIEELLTAEKKELSKPVEDTVEWLGQNVRIVHSRLGGIAIKNMLDGDPNSLVKGEQANPIVFEFFFEKPIPTTQLELTTGSMANFTVNVQLYAPGSTTPVEYQQSFLNQPNDPTVTVPFTAGPVEADHILLSIRDNNQGDSAQVHIREVQFK